MSDQQSESSRHDYWKAEGSYDGLVEAIRMQRPNACKTLLYLLAVVEEGRRTVHNSMLSDLQSNLDQLEESLNQFLTALDEERWFPGFWSTLFMNKEDKKSINRTSIRNNWYIWYVRDAQREARNRLKNN